MNDPERIGLTKETNQYLDEILETLNGEVEGSNLIKFDLYRLAVALGVKKGITPAPISGNTDSAFRVRELDPNKSLYYAVQAANLCALDESVYRIVERLGEHGIRQFYKEYKNSLGRLRWDRILTQI